MKPNRLLVLSPFISLMVFAACAPSGTKDSRNTAPNQDSTASSGANSATAQSGDQSATTASNPTAGTPAAAAAPSVDEKVTEGQMKQFFSSSFVPTAAVVDPSAGQTTASQQAIPVVTAAPLTQGQQTALATALQKTFATKMAANPGVLTEQQSQDLILKLSDFIQAAKVQSPANAAAKWNIVMDSLSVIKKSRVKAGLSLAGTATSVGIFGNYGGGPLTSLAGLLGTLVGGVGGGVAGTAVNVVGGVADTAAAVAMPVISTGAELLQTTLSIVPALAGTVLETGGAVVGTALSLVATVVDGVFAILL